MTKTEKVFERVKGEVNKRVKMLTNVEVTDVDSVCAINTKEISVTVYRMNIC